MVEVYRNPTVAVPDYASIDPLILHLAFSSDDVAADVARLVEAGAVPTEQPRPTDTGDVVAMLRDPWGFAIQLVRRAEPMV